MNITVQIDEAQRKADGLASISLSGEGVDGIELDLPFRSLHRSFGTPDAMALDLLTMASACYAVDKSVERGGAQDIWTRELSVSFPVTDAKRWSKASARLSGALSFLSGDVWRTSFYASDSELFVAPKTRRRASPPNEPTQFHAAALFSGGLDSLIGVIDFLEENATANLLLVGHYDVPGPRSQQHALWAGLSSAYPRRTKLVQVRVAQKPIESAESTLRTRSIVFIALGLYAASELGTGAPLLAPENGFIALNLPLTPSRIGSCSTRTMHPFYLDMLRRIVNDLGLKNKLVNPLEFKTKPECVSECRNRALLGALAKRSVSCSHGTRRQYWKRKSATNCGYCVPCLLRRTSLHAAGLDSGTDYGIDVCQDELHSDRTSGDDLRALVDTLSVYKTSAAIRRAIVNVARVEALDDYVALVARGLGQIRSWLAEKGSASIRKQIGRS
jgi:7-cyano-7-deazaguanine synthase in queuosine biosynthesis